MSRVHRIQEDWSLLIPYVTHTNGARISIADAVKGLGYFCPECGQAVQVRVGSKRRKHCAHIEYLARCEFREDGADRALARHALLHEVLLRAEGNDTSPIVLVRQCTQCRHTSEQLLPDKVVQAKLKFPIAQPDENGQPRLADVALLDAADRILCLVQIVRERDADGPTVAGFVELPWILLYAHRTLETPRRLVVVSEGNLKGWDCPICHGSGLQLSPAALHMPPQPSWSLITEILAYDARSTRQPDSRAADEPNASWTPTGTLNLSHMESRLDAADVLLAAAEKSRVPDDWARAAAAYQMLRRELSDWAVHADISADVYQLLGGLRARCVVGWERAQSGPSEAK